MAAVRVQSATPTSSAVSAATLTITFAGNAVVGDHIIIAGGFSGALGLTVSVADAAGNTYVVNCLTDDGNATGAYSFIASTKIGTQLNAGALITMTVSASVSVRMMCAYEYSGLDTTTWIDGTSNTGKGTSLSPASGSITTTAATDVVIGACCWNSGTAAFHTAGGSFTELNEVNQTSKGMSVDVRENVATGTFNDSGTLSSSVLWSNSIAAYKVAAAGGAAVVPQLALMGVGI